MTELYTEQSLTELDQMCLADVRRLAAELGRMPTKCEIKDYDNLKRRFGNWPNIMVQAGLKQPRAKRRPQNRERDLRNARIRQQRREEQKIIAEKRY